MNNYQTRPEDVWEKCKSLACDDFRVIASCGTTSLYATGDNGGIYLYVFDEEIGDVLYEESVYDPVSCRCEVDSMYQIFFGGYEEPKKMTEAEMEDEIVDREAELCDAFAELLEKVCGNAKGLDEAMPDIMEHVLRRLYVKHGLSVYRPCFIKDKDGKKVYEEFPYDIIYSEEEAGTSV